MVIVAGVAMAAERMNIFDIISGGQQQEYQDTPITAISGKFFYIVC